MFNTNHIIDAILENDALVESWFEFALLLEEANELEGAALALEEAVAYEEWKLLWQERLIKQETDELLDAEMLYCMWADLPDADADEHAHIDSQYEEMRELSLGRYGY